VSNTPDMAQSLVAGEPYTDDHWPHGLSCGQCRHVFTEPERFSGRVYAFAGDCPLVEIVCIPCATTVR